MLIRNYEAADLSLIAYMLGKDLHVSVFGGDVPHIGAVSVWDPDAGEVKAISLPGHKEQVITDKIARAVGTGANVRICVEAGMHYDHFSKEVLNQVEWAADRIIEDLLQYYKFQAESQGM